MSKDYDSGLFSYANPNALPNVDNAYIDPRKITNYALSPTHPVGKHKAKVFEKALGFNTSNADELINQVYDKLPFCDAIIGKLDIYGQRYTVEIEIDGTNGNSATVVTGWIIKAGKTDPELTTIYVK